MYPSVEGPVGKILILIIPLGTMRGPIFSNDPSSVLFELLSLLWVVEIVMKT